MYEGIFKGYEDNEACHQRNVETSTSNGISYVRHMALQKQRT